MPKNVDGVVISGAVLAGAGAAIPVITGAFGAITFLGRQIHTTTVNHGSNERTCQQLDAHVHEVIGLIQYLESNAEWTDKLEQPLLNLQFCLERCLEFLQKYTDASFLGQIVRNRHYKREFESLKDELNQCKENLQYALTIHSRISNKRNQGMITSTTFFIDGQRRRNHSALSQHSSRNHHSVKASTPQMSRSNRSLPRSNSTSSSASSPKLRRHDGSPQRLGSSREHPSGSRQRLDSSREHLAGNRVHRH